MKYKINQSFIQFFIELAQNNHKDWFDKNRSRYEADIKKPFTDLVDSLILELRDQENLNDLSAKDCIFRINKDVRFSKDKLPYKLQMGASICKNGRKDMENPGLYFELGPEFLNIYTGIYMPEKETLERIRIYLSQNIENFYNITSDKSFVKNFGQIKGEKNKILPQSLKESGIKHPILFNKQFYIMHQINIEKVIQKDIKNYILNIYNTAHSFNEFLRNAI
jgi:uncharacterized protein (TIGR02453 family)